VLTCRVWPTIDRVGASGLRSVRTEIDHLAAEEYPCRTAPRFDEEGARTKVQAAEDAWNTRDPERVAGERRIFGPRPVEEHGVDFPLQ
jgi:hypothetical protein